MGKSVASAAKETALLDLFDAFRTAPTENQLRAYVEALEDCSVEATRDACRAFASGTVSDFKPEYGPPHAPRLAMLARMLDAETKAREQMARRKLPKPTPPDLPEEHRAMMSKRLADLGLSLKRMKA